MYLALFNVASFSLGLLLVASGFFLVGQKAQVYDVYGSTFPMALLIVITLGITIGAMVSDTSFYKSSSSVGSCQILIFILLVVLILSLELSAFSAGLMMSDSMQGRAVKSFRQQMSKYTAAVNVSAGGSATTSVDVAREPWIDVTQRSFRCCGLNGAADWRTALPHPPTSCCQDPAAPLCNRNASQLHQRGCASVIGSWISGEVRVHAGLAMGAFLLQLAGLAASLYHRHVSWKLKLLPELVSAPGDIAGK